MLAIPAIDLKEGKVVRLLQGKFEEVIVYSDNPAEKAKAWQEQGARRLHLVDLDGAASGRVQNLKSVRQIIANIKIPVQFGGGLRRQEDIAAIIDIGVQWVILGTRAGQDLDFVKDMIREYGQKILASIDVKYKKVALRGWTETAEIEDVDLLKRLQDIGVKSFIYTDISRDGTLAGLNIAQIERVLQEAKSPKGATADIFYSGGISSLEDVKQLKALEKQGLSGMIIGKALYEEKFDLRQAKEIAEGAPG